MYHIEANPDVCFWYIVQNRAILALKSPKRPLEKTKITLFLMIPSFYMAQNDLYGPISLVWWKWNTFPSMLMESLSSRSGKWWNFSRKITKMTPWEKKNTTFSRDTFFYITQNDLYGPISLVRWKWNTFPFMLMESLSSRSGK